MVRCLVRIIEDVLALRLIVLSEATNEPESLATTILYNISYPGGISEEVNPSACSLHCATKVASPSPDLCMLLIINCCCPSQRGRVSTAVRSAWGRGATAFEQLVCFLVASLAAKESIKLIARSSIYAIDRFRLDTVILKKDPSIHITRTPSLSLPKDKGTST